jgi:drug/metabolite transporter (DMT)-like permease
MFGAQYPATKTAVTEIGPILLSVVTFALSAMVMIPFLIRESRAHPLQPKIRSLMHRENRTPFLFATLLGYFPASVVLAWGVDRSLASNAALLTRTIPVNSALLASLVLGERMTRWRWLSFALAMTGALIASDIDWSQLSVVGQSYLVGNFLILLGCWGSAFVNVYSKDLLQRFRPVRLLVGSYLVSGLFCLLLLVWLEPIRTPISLLSVHTWVGLAVLGLFSWGLAMVFFFRVLDRLDVTQVSLSIYLLPFFGILLSALTLGERISGSIIAGGILAFLGTGLIILEDRFSGATR